MLDYLLYLSLKIEPIFYKIIYMSIIASFVGIAILIVEKILKNKISPIWISRIWLVFIISLIIPIQIKSPISIYNCIPINEDSINYSLDEFIKSEEKIFSRNLKREMSEKLEVNAEVKGTNQNVKINHEAESLNTITSNYKIRQFIPIIWGLIVISSIFAYILTYIVFEIKIRKYKYENDKIEKILDSCKEKLKIKTKIKIVKQDIIKMPALFGIFNVRILVNYNIFNLSEEEIKYVFIHELSHYKRKDNVLNILITILRVIYFFNPIIWISLNTIKNDLELATDELAMKNENKEAQKEYSKTLVKLSVINSDKFLIQTICMSDGKKNLERRIDNMKIIDGFKDKKRKIMFFSIMIILVIGIIFFTESSRYVSQNEICELYNFATQNNNIHIKVEELSFETYDTAYNPQYTNNNGEIEIYDCYFKDGVYVEKRMFTKNNSVIYKYKNFNTNEGITINDENKQIEIYSVSSFENNETIWNYFMISNDIYNQKYKYYGIENIDGIECFKISFKKNERNEVEYFWINAENGLVLKSDKEYDDVYDGVKNVIMKNAKYEINSVTDENIEKPNLERYSDYEIIYK